MNEYQDLVLKAALWYASVGWHVVPVTVTIPAHTPRGKKVPVFPYGWADTATTDPETITKWFKDEAHLRPYQGIAIRTGEVSGIAVVDVDNTGLWDGYLTDLDQQPPTTFQVSSQSDKPQYYFTYDPALKTGSNSKILLPKGLDPYDPTDTRMHGVDMLADNSVVFAAPTIVWSVDRDGNYTAKGQYEVVSPSAPTALPQYILDTYTKSKRAPREHNNRTREDVLATMPEVDLGAAEAQIEDLLNWAKDEFDTMIDDPSTLWDNGCIRVAGMLVRMMNNPIFGYTEEEVYQFFADYAPQDSGFGADAHDRIIRSAIRMADGEVIEYDPSRYVKVDDDLKSVLFQITEDHLNSKHEERYTESRDLSIKRGADPNSIPEKPQADALLPNLPDEFWGRRKFLTDLRHMAWSKRAQADATLYTALATYSANVPWQYQVDTGIGSPAKICLFVGIVGPSGAGKGVTMGVGSSLVENELPKLPFGTGEGIAQAFLEAVVDMDNPDNFRTDKNGEQVLIANPTKVQKQTKHNLLLYDTEGSVIANLLERKGATIIQTLLKLAMGEDLGSTNATETSNRHVPGGSYSAGSVVGIQDALAAELVSRGDIGFSQRWLFAGLADRYMKRRGDFPEVSQVNINQPLPANGSMEPINIGIDPDLVKAMEDAQYYIATGAHIPNEYDSHRPVMLIKTAAIFRMMDGPNHNQGNSYFITKDDWDLATVVYDTSKKVREALEAKLVEIQMEKNLEEGRRQEAIQAGRAQARQKDFLEKGETRVPEKIQAIKEKGATPSAKAIAREGWQSERREAVVTVLIPYLVEKGIIKKVGDDEYDVY